MPEPARASRRLASSLLAVLAAASTFVFACKKDGSAPPREGPGPAPSITVSPTPETPPRLHAWANPITIGGLRFADHTWVTTYEAASHCPPPETYWYSWGGCHDIGPPGPARALGAQAANVAVARCICVPDLEDYRPLPDNPAHGGIDFYGISGVCHQLSNRILWATGSASGSGGAAPLTVSDAMGYGVSRFLFGTYGSNAAEWAARSQRCTAAAPPAAGTPAPTTTTMAMAMAAAPARGLEADLAAMLQERLGPEVPRVKAAKIQQIRARLLAAKEPLDRAVQRGEITPVQFANGVNELVNARLQEAAEVLTPTEYERLFGVPKGMKIGIVDPTIAEKSSYRAR